MRALKTVTHIDHAYYHDVEQLFRNKYPHRNEKYYYIILKAREQLIEIPFKLNLTADSIIKKSESSKPTWYTYFKNVEQYYQEVLEILGSVMTEHTMRYLRVNTNYKNWVQVVCRLKMLVFLSNTKNLVACYPELIEIWNKIYEQVIEGYASILSSKLKLSPKRAELFIRNIASEMILHTDKYYADPDLFESFVSREYILFLAEQNS